MTVTAETVCNLLSEADALAVSSIDKTLEAGRLLLQAKDECRHGEWLPFLKRAGVPERKAQRLMTLARSGLKSDTVSDLGGVKATLEFLTKRELPEPGTALVVFGDESRDYFNAAYVWGSTAYPGNYYAAAYNGLNSICTLRPIDGRQIDFPGESPVHLVWEWLGHHFDAPQASWIFETHSDAVAKIIFEAMDLDEVEAEQRAALNMANVHGIRLLVEQCRAAEAARAA